MGMIDQMKYAKILYLADVLEDIQNDMSRDYRCHNYTGSISVRATCIETGRGDVYGLDFFV